MTTISFTTRPRGNHIGHPRRATHCQCGPQHMPDTDGHCQRCGHYTNTTIATTWQERATYLARANAKRRKKKT